MAQSPFLLVLPRQVLPWLSAFLKSFAAVSSLTVMTGVVFLPAEMARLANDQRVFIGYCEPEVDGEKFVSLVRTFQRDIFRGDQRRIVLHNLANETATVFNVLPVRDVSCFATSPDGSKLYIGSHDGSICSLNLDGYQDCVRKLGRHVHGFPATLICTDDKTLLSMDSDALYAWDLEAWRLRWCRINREISCVAMAPDSQTLICSRGTRDHAELWELDIQTGDDVRPILSGQMWQDIRFSPDGRYLYD